MPPRRSARVVTAAERASSALSPLPLPLVLHVFSLLPVDARARAACVRRGWRITLLEPSLWTRLNLSPSSGVRVRVTDAVLAGAAGKACGQLAALDVSACEDVSFNALLAVVQANGGALRELRVGAPPDTEQTLGAAHVERLLQAAPQLTACDAEVFGDSSVPDARRMLRNEPPFQPLRLRSLGVEFDPRTDADEAARASVLALAADLAAHASLNRLDLWGAPLGTPATLNAVVDAALAGQIASLYLWHCRLSPASAPALARLLGSGTLTVLDVAQSRHLLDGPSAALLGEALRANATLTTLSLFNVVIWRDVDAAAALLGALTGHPSLRTLNLGRDHTVGVRRGAACAALGALISANAPALTELDVSHSNLGDAGLRPLFEALPANTHLRDLDVTGNGMSEAFARDMLLPAVRTNTSLRQLVAQSPDYGEENDFALEAQALVAARGAAAAAAELTVHAAMAAITS
jgi:hypothetical protein